MILCCSKLRISDFFMLLKPRVMSLVIFTGFVGLMLAPEHMHPFRAFLAIACIAVGSGAAGALNMAYDHDIDCLMERTKSRPIPRKTITKSEAIWFGLILSALSVLVMAIFVDIMAAALLAFSIFFYVVIYTLWLKRRTPQNIVIGGAAGAFPPVIGWISAAHSVSLEPLLLFAIIFIWTPPHFWALALLKNEDYAKAKIPMMPIVKGDEHTKLLMIYYSIALVLVSLIPYFIDMLGVLYLVTALTLGATFIWHSFRVYYKPKAKYPIAMFKYSILYLFALFSVMLLEKFIG